MPKSTEELLGEVSAELVKLNSDLKKTADASTVEMKNLGTVSAETKARADELLTRHAALDARLLELEQKLERRGPGADDRPKSMGQTIVDDARLAAFAKDGGRMRVEVKAAVTSLTGSAGVLVEPQREPGIVTVPERRLTIRDLLTPGSTSSNMIEYVQETGFTNMAAVVSEGVSKPESALAYELVTSRVATIAHWIHASKQILADAPMLQSQIDGRLRYGLMYVEEQELLDGDGTGVHLLGLIPQATAYAPAFTPTDMTIIDDLRLAMLQAVLAEYPATGHVLHPIDWARIELTKDLQGRYIFANPNNLAGPNLWGLPVVPTQAMAETEFLTGAFRLGAQIFDRETVEVLLSTEDRDNFIKNMVTIRAEERVGLAVYRPEAFIHGTFTAAST